jgi:hypothetical protein
MTTITRRIVKPTSSTTSGTYSESASSNNSPFESNQNDRDYRDKDDERDNDDNDDKETRLTLLEEVLLLGLKDREVCSNKIYHLQKNKMIFILFHRVIHHFGMIVSHLVYVVVF